MIFVDTKRGGNKVKKEESDEDDLFDQDDDSDESIAPLSKEKVEETD